MTPSQPQCPRPLVGIHQIVSAYRAVICDLWGVLHDGLTPFDAALDCLDHMRRHELPVILLSNSPKRGAQVAQQLKAMGIDLSLFHGPVTAGDLAHAQVSKHFAGRKLFHLGPDRDRGLLTDLPVAIVKDWQAAELVLCSGLIDKDEMDVHWHSDLLKGMADAGMPMICANPDRLVEMGKHLVPCAGALADLYEGFGGHVIWCGKPMAESYHHVHRLLDNLTGWPLNKDDILAIGDGLFTDIRGANSYGIDCLFISEGVHRLDHGVDANGCITMSGVAQTIEQPTYVMKHLVW